jgi:hypothetical protein
MTPFLPKGVVRWTPVVSLAVDEAEGSERSGWASATELRAAVPRRKVRRFMGNLGIGRSNLYFA